MGDTRFDALYARLRSAKDRPAAMAALSDSEIARALAAASKASDPMLSNILCTELENRVHRKEALLSTMEDGICSFDSAGRVNYVNDAASRLLGWSNEDAKGLPGTDIVQLRDAAGYEFPPDLHPIAAAGRGRATSGEGLVAPRGRLAFPVTYRCLPILADDMAEGSVFYFRDARTLRRREQTLAHELAIVMGAAPSFGAGLGECLGILCAASTWPVGIAWIPRPDERRVDLAAASASKPYEDFIAACRSFTFLPGVGLPGRVWTSRRPAWIADVRADPNFPRAPIARRAGLAAGFAVPLLDGGEVVAIVEFFAESPHEPDPALLRLIEGATSRLGPLVARKLHEEQARAQGEEYRAMLALTTDAVVSANSEGVITFLNDAAEKLFGHRAEEVLGQRIAILMPERYRARHEASFSRFRETGEGHVIGRRLEMHALRSDGTEVPVEITISAWEAAGQTRFTGILRPRPGD